MIVSLSRTKSGECTGLLIKQRRKSWICFILNGRLLRLLRVIIISAITGSKLATEILEQGVENAHS